MGHIWWGSPMSRQVGFYEYGVSPYHLKPLKGVINPGATLFLKRTGKQLLYIAPPVAFFYSIAVWADNKYEYNCRKAGIKAAAEASGH
ncbi:hypothetical protein BATDEDRAFT_92010 [Batrachochytrium dendrobatidis JAM81]|uniref:Cytochrome b-c1 complex subunit 8 n=2 Tax=Batrachochytrium dendrobatidis TaxID=109871 RepID=F4PC82_BATDJ|nr:uncharacterized protein BATDEDRAFT_92010 [Batrachochytrium dendrobatidis JAM81]EGF77178.1 hypothetical protein BATDEDRAFT_92010 [Batrachochytrium dendrobatidis JAM81]KAJ8330386.1 ubiquinol--cytochrome-c reductase subunit 8 [Batrachochytrium dendrobatidis]KAK5665373.1 Cytochrome b-c1 complex subunit 8, mitochondrial [Batrachochytrium dendrobatidis]OAJ44824.1 UcrQ family protein [Batrachochytrium dendrobatidis JEL423]|eukprot:XP_006682301.1 hypothetical protein BATDEDRAFT_92010 [Batrachochytrium dendrobatidis JAM81]